MKKTNLIIFILIFQQSFSQNVGINTTNSQQILHIDGAKDNSATPTAAQISNDVVVTSTGKMGVGTLSPQENLVIQNLSGNTSNKIEGILVPKITRQRAASMATNAAIKTGTLVYIDTLDGTAGGTTVDVLLKGFYYFDKTNNRWSRWYKNQNEVGLSVNKASYTNTSFTAIPANTTRCGKFLFRYNTTGTTDRVVPQFQLAEGGPITISFAVETRFSTDGFELTNETRTVNNTTWIDVQTPNPTQNTLAPAELNILYLNYPGDNLFLKVTMYAQKFTSGSSVFTINCEIE